MPLLNLVVYSGAINADINVNYIVTINWWMIWCQVFVFLSLVEYAMAISWAHFANDKKVGNLRQFANNSLNSLFLGGQKNRLHRYKKTDFFDGKNAFKNPSDIRQNSIFLLR